MPRNYIKSWSVWIDWLGLLILWRAAEVGSAAESGATWEVWACGGTTESGLAHSLLQLLVSLLHLVHHALHSLLRLHCIFLSALVHVHHFRLRARLVLLHPLQAAVR